MHRYLLQGHSLVIAAVATCREREHQAPLCRTRQPAAVAAAAEATANSITVDLARVNGNAIYGIRYAMEDATCCQHYAPTSGPCPVESCPIMGRTTRLPANPFMAHIVDGKCVCIPPQVCDE